MQNTAGGDSDVAQRPETHNYFAMKTKKILAGEGRATTTHFQGRAYYS